MSQQPKKKRNKKMTKKIVYPHTESNNPLRPTSQFGSQRNTRTARIHIPRKPGADS